MNKQLKFKTADESEVVRHITDRQKVIERDGIMGEKLQSENDTLRVENAVLKAELEQTQTALHDLECNRTDVWAIRHHAEMYGSLRQEVAENAALLSRAEKAEAELKAAEDRYGACISSKESECYRCMKENKKIKAERDAAMREVKVREMAMREMHKEMCNSCSRDGCLHYLLCKKTGGIESCYQSYITDAEAELKKEGR